MVCEAQNKCDVQWILGQGAEVKMDFNLESVDISLKDKVVMFSMSGSNISMCDSTGNLLFYSNGCEIRDRLDAIMSNGDSINLGIIEQWYCSTGGYDSPIPQGILCLPLPDHPDKFYLFNLDADVVTYDDTVVTLDPKHLYYSIIDMNLNGDLGGVVAKHETAIEDTLALARGQLTAVRHSNGRDWWVIVPKAISNCYYLLLLTPDGLVESKLECEGEAWNYNHGIGQGVFSPDGTKFARFNPWNGLHIFDFDRCKGKLSNPISIDFPQDSFAAAGLSISPNSRFLYAAARTKLYQFDLQSNNIAGSRILIDTLDLINIPAFGAVFYLSQLAPDNKIYIAGIGSHLYLHAINNPDSLGVACNFVQQGVEIPALNFASIPNFPNYRLGAALEPCDYSYSSSDKVKNEVDIKIFPNPAFDMVTLEIEGSTYELVFEVHDMLGRVVKVFDLAPNSSQHQIPLDSLPNGQYFYSISEDGQRVSSGKFIKLE